MEKLVSHLQELRGGETYLWRHVELQMRLVKSGSWHKRLDCGRIQSRLAPLAICRERKDYLQQWRQAKADGVWGTVNRDMPGVYWETGKVDYQAHIRASLVS